MVAVEHSWIDDLPPGLEDPGMANSKQRGNNEGSVYAEGARGVTPDRLDGELRR